MPGRLIEDPAEQPLETAEINAPAYAIAQIKSKGRGIVATRPIKKGTMIFSEPPLLTVAEEPSNDYDKAQADLLNIVAGMAADSQEKVFGLHNAHPCRMPELVGILQTNGFTLDDGKVSLFATACLLNHSCRPTVEAEWNEAKGEIGVYAVQDLAVGDEYVVSYRLQRACSANEYAGWSMTTSTRLILSRHARRSSASSMAFSATASFALCQRKTGWPLTRCGKSTEFAKI